MGGGGCAEAGVTYRSSGVGYLEGTDSEIASTIRHCIRIAIRDFKKEVLDAK